jgi:hypothetical protein
MLWGSWIFLEAMGGDHYGCSALTTGLVASAASVSDLPKRLLLPTVSLILQNWQLVFCTQGEADRFAYRPHVQGAPLRKEHLHVVVLGSSDVGGSTLLQRWARSVRFPATKNPCCQWCGCKHAQGLLHITDTPSNLRNQGIRRLTIARAHAFILIYSVTRKEGLEELNPFLELIQKVKNSNLHKFPIVLVGNKQTKK